MTALALPDEVILVTANAGIRGTCVVGSVVGLALAREAAAAIILLEAPLLMQGVVGSTVQKVKGIALLVAKAERRLGLVSAPRQPVLGCTALNTAGGGFFSPRMA